MTSIDHTAPGWGGYCGDCGPAGNNIEVAAFIVGKFGPGPHFARKVTAEAPRIIDTSQESTMLFTLSILKAFQFPYEPPMGGGEGI